MSNIKKISILLLCLLVIVAAGSFWILRVITVTKKEAAEIAELQRLEQEALPYQNELKALNEQLSAMRKNAAYQQTVSKIMVGFLVSELSDIELIRGYANTYGFSPIIVIDCDMPLASLQGWIPSLDPQWELMLYTPDFSPSQLPSVAAVQAYLTSIGKAKPSTFYLRGDFESTANIQALINAGFRGYTLYRDIPISGQNADGSIYFDYSYIQTNDTAAVNARIQTFYQSKASSVFTYDMAAYRAGKLTEKLITASLQKMQDYTKRADCSFALLSEVCSELSGINQLNEQYYAAYLEQAAPIQARIAVLQQQIDAIYADRTAKE